MHQEALLQFRQAQIPNYSLGVQPKALLSANNLLQT
jgi:hypothetical protein